MGDPNPAQTLWARLSGGLNLPGSLLTTYLHLIVSAIFPIYIASHSSLMCPPSAREPRKPDGSIEEDEDECDMYIKPKIERVEGFSAMDAITTPILAGITLSSLYLIITYLADSSVLNRILNAYFAFFALFSLGMFFTDGLFLLTGLIIPRRYKFRDVVFKLDFGTKRAVATKPSKQPNRESPLPGRWADLQIPGQLNNALWVVRGKLAARIPVNFSYHRFTFQATLSPLSIAGFTVAFILVAFFNLVSKPWWLTNIMGFASCYSALQMMSPTSFSIGSLLLISLFFYDIYMVFGTPMMVTVAKSLDVPIKLLFPRTASSCDGCPPKTEYAMLGLGDIVLPGLMIGLALRFDHYMYYLRQQTRSDGEVSRAKKDGPDSDLSIIKPVYRSPSGFSERFWLAATWQEFFFEKGRRDLKSSFREFPKPYFHASFAGYTLGLIATLISMHLMSRAQPALLYLVPGVLIFVWGYAYLHGEAHEMWNFSEELKMPDVPSGSPESESKFTVAPGTRVVSKGIFSKFSRIKWKTS